MLIFSKAPLFLWAKAINTACYTQNHSLICLRYNKTLYELMHDKKPNLLFLCVFGSLFYPTNDSEDLGKLNAKADIGILVGYAPAKKAFRIYNRRTRKIMETIHVMFDELTAMAFEQFSSGPGLQFMTPETANSGLVPNPVPQKHCNPPNRDDWDCLFQPMFDEYFNPPLSAISPVPVAAAPRAVDIADSPVSTSIDQDAPSTSIPSIQEQEHSPIIFQGVEESPKTPHFHDDPLHESLHEDATSQGSSSNVRPSHTLLESLSRAAPIKARCQDTRRGTSRSAQFLGDKLVSWSSKKQKSTAISSTEAEYIVLKLAFVSKSLWIDTANRLWFTFKRILLNMNPVSAQQVALKNDLFAPEKRLKTEKCNARIEFSKPQREETYQVTLDALKLSPCYPAFLITIEVPEVYMHQFWNTIKKIKDTDAYRFKLGASLESHQDLIGSGYQELKSCGGMYNKKNVDFVSLLWEDFMFQADNREISSARHL
ncbi:retrovirus-related pol polyprotein from transposon TNT 1-94 [Tanacetum coccineum]